MNILQNALNHIPALISNQKITIITEKAVNNNGFAVVECSEVETTAHIQPTPLPTWSDRECLQDSRHATQPQHPAPLRYVSAR